MTNESGKEICEKSEKVCMDYKTAKSAMNSFRKSKRNRKGHKPYRIYKCNFCNCYHLTSKQWIAYSVPKEYRKRLKMIFKR